MLEMFPHNYFSPQLACEDIRGGKCDCVESKYGKKLLYVIKIGHL